MKYRIIRGLPIVGCTLIYSFYNIYLKGLEDEFFFISFGIISLFVWAMLDVDREPAA
jgi:hypothetical protein